MRFDDRGGVRHRGRRLLTPYAAGYAAAMARAHRDLNRLNAALQAELNQVRAEIDELKVLVKLRQQSDMERVTRMRTIHEALGIPRDPIRPLQ